ncbi:MAG: transketolase [Lautropia sp.]
MANALRALAMDAVEKAKSGHPGAPMGMADMAVALWGRHLRHDPADPRWPDRDRFVLSNGHASMLLYAVLHITGYDLPIDELARFRQLGSRTPGHPEVDVTPGVETTTGPLGQGLANAVGFALAEKLLADAFNRPGHRIVDHHTWVFAGDGCLMEGISHEACALAGVWKLDKLIVLYDENGISIDGPVGDWFAEDTTARFRAYGWNVIGPIDGHDPIALDAAITQARSGTKAGVRPAGMTRIEAPTLIRCRTTIGKGSPARAGTAKAHGEPLGADEVAAVRETIGWPHPPFEVPEDLAARWNGRAAGAARREDWQRRFDAYRRAHPQAASEFMRRIDGDLPADVDALLARASERFLAPLDPAAATPVATRKASQSVLAALAPGLPELIGGSADLTGSNLTDFPDCGAVRGGKRGGRHVNYGVREFGMAAVMNGLALHGGFIPYGGTFLTFSDYARNAVRMAALMKRRVIHVFTHDSVSLGEDGPTHQPVEHAASLRLIPNLDVWRPCDTAETFVAWAEALQRRDGPAALLLSRQGLPAQQRDAAQARDIRRGGYVLSDRGNAVAVILATGSEVALAIDAQRLLDARGIAVRVVSIPSSTVFDRQARDYREAVLGKGLPRIGVEAGVSRWWGQYGCVAALGVDRFGESAPAQQVCEHLGLSAAALATLVQDQLAG